MSKTKINARSPLKRYTHSLSVQIVPLGAQSLTSSSSLTSEQLASSIEFCHEFIESFLHGNQIVEIAHNGHEAGLTWYHYRNQYAPLVPSARFASCYHTHETWFSDEVIKIHSQLLFDRIRSLLAEDAGFNLLQIKFELTKPLGVRRPIQCAFTSNSVLDPPPAATLLQQSARSTIAKLRKIEQDHECTLTTQKKHKNSPS